MNYTLGNVLLPRVILLDLLARVPKQGYLQNRRRNLK